MGKQYGRLRQSSKNERDVARRKPRPAWILTNFRLSANIKQELDDFCLENALYQWQAVEHGLRLLFKLYPSDKAFAELITQMENAKDGQELL